MKCKLVPSALSAAMFTHTSHNSDMCCSSGRRDSLGKPHNYKIPLPQIEVSSSLVSPPQSHTLHTDFDRLQDPNIPSHSVAELESQGVSMVGEMVHLATILRRISKQIYHDSKGLDECQKSLVATELDELLDKWKRQLPEWLSLDTASIREPEWATKQKLVLRLSLNPHRTSLRRIADKSRRISERQDSSAPTFHGLFAERRTSRNATACRFLFGCRSVYHPNHLRVLH
jgi:hypothetical protein